MRIYRSFQQRIKAKTINQAKLTFLSKVCQLHLFITNLNQCFHQLGILFAVNQGTQLLNLVQWLDDVSGCIFFFLMSLNLFFLSDCKMIV